MLRLETCAIFGQNLPGDTVIKIILTGATGFVGSEILAQLLLRDDISQVTCLTRRIPSAQSPKLRTVLHTDFTVYPDELAEDLAGHDGLLWALGAKADKHDPSVYERLTYTTTIACATALAWRQKKPFRFGYLSGMGADPTETVSFPWQKRTRHLKGRTERSLQTLTERFHDFRATSFRPAGILPRSTSKVVNTLLSPLAIRVDHLAHAMIEESVRSIAEHYSVLGNKTIRKIADPSH